MVQCETPKLYKDCKLVFYELADMNKVARAYRKMWQYSNNYHKSKHQMRFLSKINKSEWHNMIDEVLQAAGMVERAFAIKDNDSRD